MDLSKDAHFAIHTYFQTDYTFAFSGVAPSRYFRLGYFRKLLE